MTLSISPTGCTMTRAQGFGSIRYRVRGWALAPTCLLEASPLMQLHIRACLELLEDSVVPSVPQTADDGVAPFVLLARVLAQSWRVIALTLSVDPGVHIRQGHRWAVMERSVMHHDVSHRNILVQPNDFKLQKRRTEVCGPGILANAILEDIRDADPMGCLVDLDDEAELDRAQAISHPFVSKTSRKRLMYTKVNRPVSCRRPSSTR
ncbi:hypothetical protein AB1N83_006632 [Pleurotus pulmonarius]